MFSRMDIDGKGVGLDGDKTTTGATCHSDYQSGIEMGKSWLREGDKTDPCPLCKQIGVIAEGSQGWNMDGKLAAVDGCVIRCGCPYGTNRLIAPLEPGASIPWEELGYYSEFPKAPKVALPEPKSLPVKVFAKSSTLPKGNTNAGTSPELHSNFGKMGYFVASPSKIVPKKPIEEEPELKPWYKSFFQTKTPAGSNKAVLATSAIALEEGELLNGLRCLGGDLVSHRFGSWIAENMPTPLTVSVMGLFYSPALNQGEEDFLEKGKLLEIARQKGTVPTRVRFRWEENGSGKLVTKGYHVSAESGLDQVKVREIIHNRYIDRYEFWEEGARTPTLTWTPSELKFKYPSHTGNDEVIEKSWTTTVSPIPENTSLDSTTTPMPEEKDFRDYILVHPLGAFEPIYIYIRNYPGQVTGKGQRVTGRWLAEADKGNGAPIPSQIADKLRGRMFANFDEFRLAFWIEVSKDPELASQFNSRNKAFLENGYSPYPPTKEKVGLREKYEIHHIEPISKGGAVYDVDNMGVTTPKRHIDIHRGIK